MNPEQATRPIGDRVCYEYRTGYLMNKPIVKKFTGTIRVIHDFGYDVLTDPDEDGNTERHTIHHINCTDAPTEAEILREENESLRRFIESLGEDAAALTNDEIEQALFDSGMADMGITLAKGDEHDEGSGYDPGNIHEGCSTAGEQGTSGSDGTASGEAASSPVDPPDRD